MSTLKCKVPPCGWSVNLSKFYDDMDALRKATTLHHLENHHPIVWSFVQARRRWRRLKKSVKP